LHIDLAAVCWQELSQSIFMFPLFSFNLIFPTYLSYPMAMSHHFSIRRKVGPSRAQTSISYVKDDSRHLIIAACQSSPRKSWSKQRSPQSCYHQQGKRTQSKATLSASFSIPLGTIFAHAANLRSATTLASLSPKNSLLPEICYDANKTLPCNNNDQKFAHRIFLRCVVTLSEPRNQVL
jgi:hypothetical protein